MAPVHEELQSRDQFEPLLMTTGQHREMLDQVCQVFDMQPDVSLDIMQHDQTIGGVIARAFTGLEAAFREHRPDIVLVQGDTATTFTGALTGFLEQITVGHVEAGLRSGNRHSPFPEEVFRRMIGPAADVHLPATDRAKENLLAEGVDEETIFVCGNPVIDALLTTRERCGSLEGTEFEWVEEIDGRIMLVTAHRRENLGVPLTRVCNAIARLVERFDDLHVVFPMHLNPKVRRAATELLGDSERVRLCEPADYVTFVSLMDHADIILTDSGGIQEEAPALGIPVLVARDTTERPEGVEAEVVRLVGTDTDAVFEAGEELLSNPSVYARMASGGSPYGDGRAAERICDALEYVLELRDSPPEPFAYEREE